MARRPGRALRSNAPAALLAAACVAGAAGAALALAPVAVGERAPSGSGWGGSAGAAQRAALRAGRDFIRQRSATVVQGAHDVLPGGVALGDFRSNYRHERARGFAGAVPRPRAPTHGPRLPPLQFAVLRPVPPRLTACVGAPPDLACTHGAPRAGRGDLGNSLVSPLSCMPRCRPQTAHGARPWFVGRSEMARSPGQRLGFSY